MRHYREKVLLFLPIFHVSIVKNILTVQQFNILAIKQFRQFNSLRTTLKQCKKTEYKMDINYYLHTNFYDIVFIAQQR